MAAYSIQIVSEGMLPLLGACQDHQVPARVLKPGIRLSSVAEICHFLRSQYNGSIGSQAVLQKKVVALDWMIVDVFATSVMTSLASRSAAQVQFSLVDIPRLPVWLVEVRCMF